MGTLFKCFTGNVSNSFWQTYGNACFPVKCGVDSISFNPDALIKGIENMYKAENKKPVSSK